MSDRTDGRAPASGGVGDGERSPSTGIGRRTFIAGAAGTGLAGAIAGALLAGLDPTRAEGAQAPSGPCFSVRDFGARGTGTGDDSKAFGDALAAAGAAGGFAFAPRGEYPVAVVLGQGARLEGETGTVLRAVGASSVVRLAGRGSSLARLKVAGNDPDHPARGLAAHCVEVRAAGTRLEEVTATGARFDSVYVRGGQGAVFRDCTFGPSARNACSIVEGSDLWFERCEFAQDGSVASSQQSGLYLYDIEPETPRTVRGVMNVQCTFRSDLKDGYAGILLSADANGPNGDCDVSFLRCSFERGATLAPAIRPRNGRTYRGLRLIDNTFAGMVLVNDKQIVLTDSEIIGNRHASQRFSYNVGLDRVVLVNNHGSGWAGLRTTGATVRVDVP